MFEPIVENWNRIAVIVAANLVNTAAITVAAVTVAAIASRFKSWSAATRYGLWWLMLAFVVAAPFASAVLPGPQTPSLANAPIIHLATPAEPAAVTLAIPQAPLTVLTPLTPPPVRPSAPAILLLCWLVATLVQSFRIWRSFLFGLRLKRTSHAAGDELQSTFARLCTQASLRRPVRLCISDRISSPAVVGYWRPFVMIPDGLVSRLDFDELEQILLHELSHIYRYDDWSIAAQRLIEAVGICHPLIWFLGRRLSLDREMACDDRVLSLHESRHYATCLAKIAQASQFPASSPVLVPLLEGRSELLARVESMLDKTRTHMPKLSAPRLLGASLVSVVLGVIGLRAPRLMALAPSVVSLPKLPIAPLPVVLAQPVSQPQPPPAVAQPTPPLPVEKVSPKQEPSEVYSIVLTTENGETSTFGKWSGNTYQDANREPGTIEFKTDDKVYVIRDKEILAKAQQLLQPMRELGRKQGELGERQGILGEVQGRLGRAQESFSFPKIDPEMQAQIDRALRDVKEQLEKLNTDLLEKQTGELQEKLAEMQAKLGEMQSKLGSRRGLFTEQQGRMAEQLRNFARQQADLGKLQGDLARQQAAEAKHVEKELQELIRDAISRGLALQVK